MNHKWLITISLLLTTLFLFLRLYNLDQSLYFFNDIGRDFLVLYNWQETGKPPLLGPQTSALPFNQSAIYFYILFPLFFISQNSQYSSVLTNLIFYVVSFWIGLYLLRNHKILQNSLLVVAFLITIHPQFIIQQRFVWNPSFVAPLILASVYGLLVLKDKYRHLTAFIVGFSMAWATAFSYSVVPVVISTLLISIFWLKRRVLWLIGFFLTSLVIVNFPTIFFELRHKFLLTNMLINQEKLSQPGNILSQKIANLSQFSISSFLDHPWYLFLILVLVIIIALQLVLIMKARRHNHQTITKKQSLFLSALLLLLLGVLTTLATPIAIQAHYIFGVLVLGLLVISFLDKKLLIFVLTLASFLYLRPQVLSIYYSPAPRSYAETYACAVQICQQVKQPTFVSVQASRHPYHNGMEFQYLLKKAGCDIKTLDPDPNVADKMIVIVDDSEYTHNQTAYNELTQFGKSEEIGRLSCSTQLEAVFLNKITE